ncbi:MAG TPA: histidine kinase [Agriterribacter sp.]|nr:histidine kinase [Agriterribacter sp.]
MAGWLSLFKIDLPLQKKSLIIFSCLLCCLFAMGQTEEFIDLGRIKQYDTVLKRMAYFIDYSKSTYIQDVPRADFFHPKQNSPFNWSRLVADYYMQLQVTNSSQQDTFWLYMGKAQQYTLYEYDSSGKKLKKINTQFQAYSPAVFSNIPFAYFIVQKGQRKAFYIHAEINFYNWLQFDPVILLPHEITTFAFRHFLQHSRLYLASTIALLGIMLSMLAYTSATCIRTKRKDYFYYSGALFVFAIYFVLRLFNLFVFSDIFYFLYDFRYQFLQLCGNIFVLLFISSFLGLKENLPQVHMHFRIIIIIQLIFLAINLPITYTNQYNYLGNVAFDMIRLLVLLYSVCLVVYLLTWKNAKEVRYVCIGSFAAIVMACLGLYLEKWNNYRYEYFLTAGIPVLAFMVGITCQMFFYLQALFYRERRQDAERVRAVEQLQLENDKKELDKYRAIIEARDNERNRISQEIHDDIGSGLTSIRLLSEIAKAKRPHLEGKELEKISFTSSILMDKMNEIIWTLNSRNDTLPNLVAYLRQMIGEFFEPFPIQLTISSPDAIADFSVNGETRRNILLSVKEVLHNVIKHAHATSVHVGFTVDQYFSITISDNGVGFDPSATHSYSNGLRNIKQRLANIQGLCIISNNNGTSVLLKSPLKYYPF